MINSVHPSQDLTFFGSSVNGPWEFGVRCGGLGCYDDVGPILCCLQSNGLPNASACSSDENGLPCQQPEIPVLRFLRWNNRPGKSHSN